MSVEFVRRQEASQAERLRPPAGAQRRPRMEISVKGRALDVMAVLWERGASTVAEVREALADEFAYTTVLTLLRRLETKGLVGHVEEGRIYRYHALVKRKVAGDSALRSLMQKMFAGRPELLLEGLVSDEKITPAELRRMRALLDARLQKAGGSARH